MDEKVFLSRLSTEEKERNKRKWICFYRQNIHRFIEMHLGIILYPHQRLEFYAMSQSTNYAEIASRGTAKSWKAAVFASSWAILYPKSEIVIVSSAKKQAGLIVKKIKGLVDVYENLEKEIKSITTNNNDMEAVFKNGSKIVVVPLRDTAKGERATLIIKEEARLLDKKKYDLIISPFKHPRQAEFLKIPKYSKMVEEPREITITSSGRESEDFYKDIKKIIKQELSGKDSFVIFADYILGLRYNMHTPKQICEERVKMGEESFFTEYENGLVVENGDSFFPKTLLDNSRKLKIAYYPQHKSKYVAKKNPFAIPMQNGELIVLSVDIALKASSNDDNTIISVLRLTPTKKGYLDNVVYMETMRGKNSIIQALRIKQIWYDFSANYIVLDANNAGTAIYDIMTEITIDTERGIEYPAMTTIMHKSISKYQDYKDRTRSINAIPIIYPMWATNEINSEIAYMVKELLKSDMLRLMCPPSEGEEFLMENAKYFNVKTDMGLLSWFMRPYYQASEAIHEMQNLSPIYSGTSVKLIEPYNGRKDRYSSIGYGCYFVKIVLDPLIVKEVAEVDYRDSCIISSGNNISTGTLTATKQQRFGAMSNNRNQQRKFFGR